MELSIEYDIYTKNIRGDIMEISNNIKIYLMRHGETDAGNDIFVGITDANLTEKGISQTKQMAKFFIDKPIKEIYSSQLKRAKHTAEIIKEVIYSNTKNDIPLYQCDLLSEMDFGEWEKMNRNDIKEKYKELYKKWEENPSKNTPPKAGAPKNVAKNIARFLDKIYNKFKKDAENGNNINIIAVSHKTAIRILLCYLDNKDLKYYRDYKINEGDIFEITHANKGWKWKKINTSDII